MSNLSDCTDGVILYGAGGKGRSVRDALQALGVRVRAFIDRNAQGAIDGTPVYHPDAAVLREFAASGIPVVVAIFNHVTPPMPIYDTLKDIGFASVHGFMDVCKIIDPGDTYWLTYSSPMVPEPAEVEWLSNRLHDETSRRVLAEVLSARRTGDILLLPEPSPESQYFPSDVPLQKGPIHYVDVGAFEGETICALANNGFVFSRITAIEPDLLNFEKLAATLARHVPCDDVVLLPCGLGNKTEFVAFQGLGQPSSAVGERGNATALVVAFDDAVHCSRVDYIKLDVEGAELLALEGCKNTILLHHPAIAVAVYHKPADLWQIPRFLDELVPDSRFYLRSHGQHGFDLVLYAVP